MNIKVKHDSWDLKYREPFGALATGETVSLRLEVETDLQVDACLLRLAYNREVEENFLMMEKKEAVGDLQLFEFTFDPLEETGLYWYYFILVIHGETWYYGNNEEGFGGIGVLSKEVPKGYQITLYKPVAIPEWFKKGIIYQIYVDRFYNGNEDGEVLNPKAKSLIHGDWYDTPFYLKTPEGRIFRWDFFGGNLKGVIKKIAYLKELGVSIIYFNPIFESASNHKYDVGDFLKIDSMYGDIEDFKNLVASCEQAGIKIILDGVFNHTGSSSLYFNKYGTYPGLGAFQGEDSPYYHWYSFDHQDNTYKSWWGVDDLPEVNKANGEFQDFIYKGEDSVIKTWLREGVKGWRLDVVDELPDYFVRELKTSLKAVDPEGVLIGEVWEDASNKVSYGKQREYFSGYELDSAMNYPFRETLIKYFLYEEKAFNTARRLMSLYENYPRENFMAAMNLIGSHDRERILTVLGGAKAGPDWSEIQKAEFKLDEAARKLAVKRLKLLSVIQLTFPGVPAIYYGDEAGLEGFLDPYNRKTYPWGREDQELLLWYKKLNYLRNSYEFWFQEEFTTFALNDDVFAFRVKGSEELVVYVNRSVEQGYEIALPEDGRVRLELLRGSILSSTEYYLPPLEAGVFVLKEKNGSTCFNRSAGVLLPIFSLPADFGVGDLGVSAFEFVDFLAYAGFEKWQVLPNNPIGKADSPYYSSSVFAGNPLYISLDKLKDAGLLGTWELLEQKALFQERELDTAMADYEMVRRFKVPLLRKAYDKFIASLEFDSVTKSSFQAYIKENSYWLIDYGLFSYLEEVKGGSWQTWGPLAFNHDQDFLDDLLLEKKYEIEYFFFLQFIYYSQWLELKNHANSLGVEIIGDLPIYVAENSCDVWAHRELFNLDKRGYPALLAGVPPDYFSSTGQLWGNPTYNWEVIEKEEYSWWLQRVALSFRLFDFVRLDHFRGFESYFGVEAGEATAVNGKWYKGPGMKLFKVLKEELGSLSFLAEDLGYITPEVDNLKNVLGFPGMEIYQFKKAGAELSGRVYYSGTHDTDTLAGWLALGGVSDDGIKAKVKDIIEEMMAGSADLVIFPVQDLLALDSGARINLPGSVGDNWKWRLKAGELDDQLALWCKEKILAAGR